MVHSRFVGVWVGGMRNVQVTVHDFFNSKCSSLLILFFFRWSNNRNPLLHLITHLILYMTIYTVIISPKWNNLIESALNSDLVSWNVNTISIVSMKVRMSIDYHRTVSPEVHGITLTSSSSTQADTLRSALEWGVSGCGERDQIKAFVQTYRLPSTEQHLQYSANDYRLLPLGILWIAVLYVK